MEDVTLEASCQNCAHFSGACGLGTAPPPGEPRCDRYAITDAFASLLASRVLQETTIEALVPLRPLSNAERRKLRNRAPPRHRRGFRS